MVKKSLPQMFSKTYTDSILDVIWWCYENHVGFVFIGNQVKFFDSNGVAATSDHFLTGFERFQQARYVAERTAAFDSNDGPDYIDDSVLYVFDVGTESELATGFNGVTGKDILSVKTQEAK